MQRGKDVKLSKKGNGKRVNVLGSGRPKPNLVSPSVEHSKTNHKGTEGVSPMDKGEDTFCVECLLDAGDKGSLGEQAIQGCQCLGA